MKDWLDLPRTFAEARALGSKHYFTGKPCPKGHICPRFASNFSCQHCLNLQSARWLEKNQGYNKVRCSNYAKKNPAGNAARSRRWYHTNREKALALAHAAYIKNPEPKKADARRRHEGMSGIHKSAVITLLKGLQKGKCYWCRKPLPKKIHVDHIFSRSKGGTDAIENLCLACQPCNSRKHNKTPMEFAGRLF